MSEDARNESSATIGGHSVQAGQIHGGVHFHHDGGSERTPVIPRQLPTASRHFTNRAVEQDALTTLLNGPATEDRVLVSTVDGTAGVGKSTLAVHWAHRMRDRFPDGELYANLRGFDPAAEPMPASEALDTFLTGLGVAAERIPVEAEARAALFRSLLHDKQMLVLLDNARSAEQVRCLLPASPTCLVLVTSRNRLQDLVIREGALRMTLDVLTDNEARDLLQRHLGQQRLDDEPQAVDELVEHCAGLPLALGIVAFRAAEEPEFPLRVLVDELRNERERLDALDAGGETGVRAVFSWSYRSLTEDAARMFRLLGLPNGPDISLAAAADLAGLPHRAARTALAELTRAHLLDQHEPGRYVFHDLLRAYAAERAENDETTEQRDTAVRRLLDHYLRTSHRIEQQLVPHLQLPSLKLPASEVEGVPIHDDEAALHWWDTERANLVAAVEKADQAQLNGRSYQLALTLRYFFKTRGHTEDWIATYETALSSARKDQHRKAEAHLLLNLGIADFSQGQYERTVSYQNQARLLFEEVQDQQWTGVALLGLGESYKALGDDQSAFDFFHRALDLHQVVGDHHDLGAINTELGELHSRAGRHAEAYRYLEEALRCYGSAGKTGKGATFNALGHALHRAGEPEQAKRRYQQAVVHRQEIGHRQGEAESLRALGTVLTELGDQANANESFRRSLTIFDELGLPEADDLRADLEEAS